MEVLDHHVRVQYGRFADMGCRAKRAIAEVALLSHFSVATSVHILYFWLFISHLVLRVQVGAWPIDDGIFSNFGVLELTMVVHRGSNDAVVLFISGFRLLDEGLLV